MAVLQSSGFTLWISIVFLFELYGFVVVLPILSNIFLIILLKYCTPLLPLLADPNLKKLLGLLFDSCVFIFACSILMRTSTMRGTVSRSDISLKYCCTYFFQSWLACSLESRSEGSGMVSCFLFHSLIRSSWNI